MPQFLLVNEVLSVDCRELDFAVVVAQLMSVLAQLQQAFSARQH